MSSSRAFSWRNAIVKSGLNGECRHLLLTLSLYMNELGEGAYPSLQTLADDCGKSLSWAKKWMAYAAEEQWIKIEKMKILSEASDNRGWKRNQYFARWPDREMELAAGEFSTENPARDAPDDLQKGGPRGDPPSEKGGARNQKGGAREGKKVVHHVDSNSPENQSRESLQRARGGANGADAPEREKKDLKKLETWFWEITPKWPKFTSSSKPDALKVFLALTDEERQQSADRMEAYIAACRAEGISAQGFCALKTYFAEKRWQAVEQPVVCETIVCNPLGKAWMAWRFKLMEKPPRIWQRTRLQQAMIDQGKMHLLAADRARGRYPEIARMDGEFRPFNLSADTELGDLDGFEPVKIGSAEWDAWQDWFDEKGVPRLPEPGSRGGPPLSPGQDSKGVFAWFPSSMPPELPPGETPERDEDLEEYEAFHGV